MAKKSAIFGFDELAKKLSTMTDGAEVGKVLRSGVRSVMNTVKKEAEARIPVGTVAHRTYKGNLVAPGFAKRSLKIVTRLDKSGQKASAVLGVRAEAFYAIQFVELGTSKMPAHPWLRPSFMASKDAAVNQVGDAFKDWVISVARKHAAKGNSERASQLLGSVGETSFPE